MTDGSLQWMSSDVAPEGPALILVDRRGPARRPPLAVWGPDVGAVDALLCRLPRSWRFHGLDISRVKSVMAEVDGLVLSIAAIGHEHDWIPLAWDGSLCVPTLVVAWFDPARLHEVGVIPPVVMTFPTLGATVENLLHRMQSSCPEDSLTHALLARVGPRSILASFLRRSREVIHRPGMGALHVSYWPPVLGCSEHYLRARATEADINLRQYLRYRALLSGLGKFHGGASWTSVAVALGFSTSAGWSNFVRRGWMCTPTEAAERPVGQWISLALREMDTGC